MPRYYARLDATDGSGHFRFITIYSANEAEARAALERREQGFVMYRLTTDELAACEQQVREAEKAGGKVPGDVRAKLALHNQTEPYELTYFGDSRRPPRAEAVEQGKGES